jgi:hypothetical protein
MRKFNLFLTLIAIVMLVGLTNCKKENANPPTTKYVGSIALTFTATDGNITLKSYPDKPVGVTRTWKIYRLDPIIGVPTVLVDGSEFPTGSPAQIWWSTAGNNPFTLGENVSADLAFTPLEDIRITTENKDANGVIEYLGMLNFNASHQASPGDVITVNEYRLGDVLVVNADAIKSFFNNIVITVDYQLKPINLPATEMQYFGGTWFSWVTSDFVYGTPVSHTTTLTGSGDNIIYDGFTDKVTGNIIITIVPDGYSNHAFHVTVPASNYGKGMLIKLITTKVGSQDNSFSITDNDITVETTEMSIGNFDK